MPPETPENPITPKPSGGESAGSDQPTGRVLRAQVSSAFVGPLPPPQILSQYEQLCPGSAQRLIELVHIEGKHRREMDSRTLDAQIEEMRKQFWEARIGQICALTTTLVFVFVGAYVITRGYAWSGTILGGLGLGGVVSAFIMGRNRANSTQQNQGTPQS
jgi:uncharacterized membrane protein